MRGDPAESLQIGVTLLRGQPGLGGRDICRLDGQLGILAAVHADGDQSGGRNDTKRCFHAIFL
jgi:hypothetical protein